MRTIEKITIQLASKAVELSEYKNYLELTNRVCFYNEANYNGVKLVFDDKSLEIAQTLVDMPVVAKYIVDSQGKPNLKDHCVSFDENGEIQFLTESVGTHTDVWIADDTVETCSKEIKTLPCLFAKMRIWTRHKNYIEAIKRLYEEGDLHNSWEISSFSYNFDNGIKTLGDYVFDGNALLGNEGVYPAYGEAAKILDLSSVNKQTELLIASALSADLIQQETDINNTAQEKEENMLKGKQAETSGAGSVVDSATEPVIDSATEPVAEPVVDSATEPVVDSATEPVVEPASTEEPELSAADLASLTLWDLQRKINQACRNKIDSWCYIAFWFPADNTVWVRSEEAEQELDYLLFTYEVSGEEVVVSDPTAVKLTVSVASINKAIEERNEAMITANAQIETLTSQNKSLESFKDAFEKAEAEKKEAQRAALIESMRQDAEDSNCFTDEELESDELKEVFETADINKLKVMIADRSLMKLRKGKATETATTVKPPNVKTDLANEDAQSTDYLLVMRKFLNN